MGKFKNKILLFFKGVAMGGADVVPGVSGGTIAFITGIYTELLESIGAIDIEALKLLMAGKIKEFWIKVNGTFLLILLLGILTSVFSLAKLLKYLLTHQPIHLWSFFFGLIIISSVLVIREVKKWKLGNFIALLIGIIGAYLITELSPAETPETWWFVLLSGAIAICAMILPGISGSFILLILGKFEYILTAIDERDIITLSIFGLGCILGLLSFSRGVSWLLKKYHDLTVALLAGVMIGSLNKVWPWKVPLGFRVDSHGEQVVTFTKNILPAAYYEKVGEDPYLFQAILFMALGIFLVVLIEKIARYRGKTA